MIDFAAPVNKYKGKTRLENKQTDSQQELSRPVTNTELKTKRPIGARYQRRPM